MNVVLIIPTGIGAEIGGHAGDANPVAKLMASTCDILITHPNVVNASDINEMTDNTWYVEGSILDRFLEGKIKLKKPKSNKILLVVNKPIRNETVNAVNAARRTIGCEIEVVELSKQLKMSGYYTAEGLASGDVSGWEALVDQISDYTFDALAIASLIDVNEDVARHYLTHGGVNPWGGVEAKASRLIAEAINKPVAHSPIDPDNSLKHFNEVVDPRIAAEVISQCYLHSVFKGLHRAPRIVDEGISHKDIDCLVTPWQCFGRPHKACIESGIPMLGVKENTTCYSPALMIRGRKELSDEIAYWVDNYVEAAGWLQCVKAGITRHSVSNDFLDEVVGYTL